MRILILIPLWRRPEIVRIFLHHLKSTLPDFEIMPLFILSPEDPDREILEYQIRGFERCYCENVPLGRKMNYGLSQALNYEFDYLMNIGSDNVYTFRLWELYESYFIERCPFFGINDIYYYSIPDNEALFIKSYAQGADDSPMPIGAGRCLRRDLVTGDLYRDEWNWGMDGASAWTLQQRGHLPTVIPTNGEPVMLDIKTATNLTQWVELKEYKHEIIPVDFIKIHFKLDQFVGVECFELLTFDGFHDSVLKLSNELPTRKDAFNVVNEKHRQATGEKRYTTYESYRNHVSQKLKK